eukprot:CAMPEP_0198213512 /NCGR_PEP_ID=MMETSP1445-20131203/28911_1 /TAXON_ID=36898 /ORGANISM="Pyramimonas sp., Strain CCMP2087" /LENGTH=718 /DNA_ID=CAMNT_0043888171 /DNA_START=76 /DNA_END=2232 /DNA_ORIENTATION=+
MKCARSPQVSGLSPTACEATCSKPLASQRRSALPKSVRLATRELTASSSLSGCSRNALFRASMASSARRGSHTTCMANVVNTTTLDVKSETIPEPEQATKGKKGKKGSSKKQSDSTGASSISSGVRLEGISKAFKNVEILKDVSWECKKGERVGLVGNNGCGKTTQLQIIIGKMQADSGNVIMAPRAEVAYLTQEFEVVMQRTVREEFMSVYAKQQKIQQEMEETEAAIGGCLEDMDRMQELLDKLDKLQQQANNTDMYSMDKSIDGMMGSLGFTEDDNDRLVASFSGGWQMRMSLGKILLQKPDLLLLDEPTNHLDLDTVEWLETYLKSQEVPMVIVSHDRAFLDQLCTKIVETERGVAKTWKGNYSDFVSQKNTWVTQQMTKWERQQKELAATADMINRLSGGGQAGRAEAAKKALEKMKSEGEMIEKPFIQKKRMYRFPQSEKSGRVVARVENMSHNYGNKVLFEDANLLVEAGERIAIVGPNGCGKSTFLRLLLNNEKPNSGILELGEHNIVPIYFEQNQAEALDPSETVLATLEHAAPREPAHKLKALLGRFQFQGDMIHKRVEFLSGGEKARVALAKFMVTPATLMVLDEPTNHLDIQSKEMLEEAVKHFEGTVIAVSHDRYFLREIATRVIDVKEGQFKTYEGDYQYFLESNEEAAAKEERFNAKEEEVRKDNIKAKSKMSKAEKMKLKKEKARDFGGGPVKKPKNAGRWN